MVYENLIPKTEIVHELKENYEIKTSKLSPAARTKVIRMYGGNYQSPLVDKGISAMKGYGPCYNCDNAGLTFRLEIILRDYRGGWKKDRISDVESARETASKIIRGVDFWSGTNFYFSSYDRESLVEKINRAIDEHVNDNRNIIRTVTNDINDEGGGSCQIQ